MTTRVRYTLREGLLVAEGLVSTTLNDTLYVVLSPQTLTANVFDSKNDTHATITSTSVNMLKRQVKNKLEHLGVSFLRETRNRSRVNEQAA